jgi:hypothetical protein
MYEGPASAQALMFAPYHSAQLVGCFAFIIAAVRAGWMGVMWARKVTQWTFERLAQAVGIAVYVLAVTPLMIYFAWPMASARPAVNGNCNNFGNNNINCSSLSFTPPHRRLDPDKLEAFSERQTPPYLSTRSRLIIPEID